MISSPNAARFYLPFALLLVIVVSALSVDDVSVIPLPGTQPGVVQTFNETPANCQTCHQTQSSGHTVTITADWQGSAMSHSARDPIFYASVAVANKYVNGSGEYCLRCHSPTGWLEGRCIPATGQALTGNDLQGVQCEFCHRMKDPLIPDPTINPPVPGYGNGMYVAQVARTPKRGPYSDALPVHGVQQDTFYRSSNFCGVCHNVSNPMHASNPVKQSPHEYGPIERTYSEWLLSWYATQGGNGTCQSCHMQRETGYGCYLPSSPLRTDLARHDLTGGNTFLPDILPDFWPTGLDTARLAAGKQRAVQTLQRAADLTVNAYRMNDTIRTTVRVTNMTGHKLPTGYPEGRRMWLNLIGRNAGGDTVFQSGAYNFQTADLTRDAQAKVYEMKPGLTAAQAAQYSLPPGPSFHFILNDTIFLDNRIPPKGFSNAAFAQHRAAPVGYAYADGQDWDETRYVLPSSAVTVTATLYYQTASKEYITFLRDENIGNVNDWRSWGDSLYSSWSRRGKSRPVAMDTLSATVRDSVTSVGSPDPVLPATITLSQNYPNPFNPSTLIEFTTTRETHITLRVFDILGSEVATIANGKHLPGTHRVRFDALNLPSGIYFYELAGSGFRQTRKMLLLR